jgi:hypothetical protein
MIAEHAVRDLVGWGMISTSVNPVAARPRRIR